MTVRKTWEELKRQRMDTPERRAGYERARRAYAVGVKVRQLRVQRGLSQAELARRMGTTQSVITRLELGGAEPRFETLERVSRALDVELIIDLRPREPVSHPM